jgi:hypothetical protein
MGCGYGDFRHIPDGYRVVRIHVGVCMLVTLNAVQPLGAAACAYFEVAAACILSCQARHKFVGLMKPFVDERYCEEERNIVCLLKNMLWWSS